MNVTGVIAPVLFTLEHRMNITINDILLVSKYIICSCIALGILFAPAWIARQNGHGKPKMHAVRMGSWVFGWSIIGWFIALFWATRK